MSRISRAVSRPIKDLAFFTRTLESTARQIKLRFGAHTAERALVEAARAIRYDTADAAAKGSNVG